MQIVYAKQPFPEEWTSCLFLAGPTPRSTDVPSWRPEALRLLEEMGYDGVVCVPEPPDGEWAPGADAYTNQIEWERQGLDFADAIVFWVPRNMETMPALTTNIEAGLYVASGKIVLGAPEWASSIRYLQTMLKTECGGERQLDLGATLKAATDRIDTLKPVLRANGERHVPLHIWHTASFQAWYKAQVEAGNRLDTAKVLWHFEIPKIRFVFSFVLRVKVWIASEQRWKENEFIFARPDISTIVLYYDPPDSQSVIDAEIVIVREFRSPARTEDGFIRELAGGSSFKGKNPLQTAADEVHEETGLIINSNRFRHLESRQVAGTLSTHHSHLFAAEITEVEMHQAKQLAANNTVNGVEEDSERTYVEVHTFQTLLEQPLTDWSTLGMIARAILLTA